VKVLNVDGCGGITDRGLLELADSQRCAKLREINIAGCAGISLEGMRTARAQRPDILIVW
jgi:hypothetical protein